MKVLIIACSVLKHELESVDGSGVCIEYLEQGLHRTPTKMPAAIQGIIDQAGEDIDYIVLGYGSCGSGIVGVKAGKQPLVIPRAHDCISFWLGSTKAHQKEHEKTPGTYYLTRGYIEEGKPPMVAYEEYKERFGEETARWVINEEFKNYTRVALIDTGAYDLEKYRQHARETAEFLGTSYEEIMGSLDYFEKIIKGEWNKKDFLILQPGEEFTQSKMLEILGFKISPRT